MCSKHSLASRTREVCLSVCSVVLLAVFRSKLISNVLLYVGVVTYITYMLHVQRQ